MLPLHAGWLTTLYLVDRKSHGKVMWGDSCYDRPITTKYTSYHTHYVPYNDTECSL